VDDVLLEAFHAFRDFSFAQFRRRKQGVTSAADAALAEVSNFGQWLSNSIQDGAIGTIKEIIRENINDVKKLKDAPPETLGGQVLRTIMSTVEESDFDAIIKVLESAATDHELKWIIRCVVDYVRDDKDGRLLQEGIRRILHYGEGIEKTKTIRQTYYEKVISILDEKGILYEK
jgi:hypothetical protein